MRDAAPPRDAWSPIPPPEGAPSDIERVFLGIDGPGGWPRLGWVTVRRRRSAGELDTRGLVALLKHRHGPEGPAGAFGHFVSHRGLKPEVDLKAFTAIWEGVEPDPAEEAVELPFSPQWFDPDAGVLLQTRSERRGVVDLLWSDGRTGTSPAYLRGRFELDRLRLMPRDGAPRYEAEDGTFAVLDRWSGRRMGPFGSRRAASDAARRVNESNRLRWLSQGLEVLG